MRGKIKMSERTLPVLEVGTIQEEDEEEEEETAVNGEENREASITISNFTESSNLLAEVTKQRLTQKRIAESNIDEGSDTDLELEEEKSEFDVTGKITYLNVCKQFGLVPVSYFLRHMTDSSLSLAHHGLGSQGIKALSYPLMKNTKILNLDLEDNWLEGEGGEHIAQMLLENCYITDLNLANNKLGSKGCEAICRALQTNVTLKNLNLSGNDLSGADSGSISEAFYENNRLKTVNLSHNNFGHSSTDTLAEAISENETIENIDLSWNNFRLKSATVICDGIATNSRLRVVNLAMNGLGNEGAFGVAEILKQSGTVTSIDISQNRIGPIGATVIGKALETNDLLKTLKIGYNPLGIEGVKCVFKGVCPDASCVTDLDFSGIEVDKEFRNMKEQLQETKAITIKHGPVLSDYVIVIKPKKKAAQFFGLPISDITTDNIMVTIKSYCDDNGLLLYDNMLNYDNNKERKLSRQDFLSAFSDVCIELSSTDIETMDNLLTNYKTQEGKIDFSSLK